MEKNELFIVIIFLILCKQIPITLNDTDDEYSLAITRK